MIKTLNDLYAYIEEEFERKLTQAEKHSIRCQMICLQKSVYEILEMLDIDSSKIEIQ